MSRLEGVSLTEQQPFSPPIGIFTDLDGTLVAHSSYSADAARPALIEAKEKRVPIIIVSSKTESEVQTWQRKLDIGNQPRIVENGGATFIPNGYFNFTIEEYISGRLKKNEAGITIEYGIAYDQVRHILHKVRDKTNIPLRGIGDMSVEEFARETGLSLEDAEEGKKRQYQEGFVIDVSKQDMPSAQEKVKSAIEDEGFTFSLGGRFCQIYQGGSKELAVTEFSKLLKQKYPAIITVGVGDAQADFDFLERCDQGYLVANPDKIIGPEVKTNKIHRVKEIGPIGWNKIIHSLLN